ncbi:MAG: MoaD/ThiS family protein, partial [Pseudomonadota bacterium]|nr:MoaD/ThiS family protein [Pseudomonadota bacterium]
MLNIHYFASIREIVGKDSEHVELPSGASTVKDLVEHLSTVNPAFK